MDEIQLHFRLFEEKKRNGKRYIYTSVLCGCSLQFLQSLSFLQIHEKEGWPIHCERVNPVFLLSGFELQCVEQILHSNVQQ